MKNLILLFICFASVSISSISQITTTSVSKAEEVKPSYNGEVNFLGKDVDSYVGQQLYLMPKHETLREYGYRDLMIDYNKPSYDDSNKYKMGEYSALTGKYFDVLEVIEDGFLKYFLKLQETESGDVLYFKYSYNHERSFPFLVVSYYEACNKKFIDKKLITRGNHLTRGWTSDEPMNDMVTGNIISFEPGIEWTCEALTIEEQWYTFSAILVNDIGEKVTISVDKIEDSPYSKYVFFYDDVLDYIGTPSWDLIINAKIREGMTEEEAKLSWGKPDKINKSSTGDQWVYGSQYLYFDNGKLTSWN